MTEQDDLTLVRQCLAGNQNAFGALMAKHQKAVFNVALRMVKDYHDAQDLAQAVFVKAYEKLDTFDAEHKFFSWIYRMAVNESLNFVKRRRRLEKLDESAEYASAEQTPAEDYEESEMSRNIQNALMDLEVDQRAVIVLKHFEDLSYEEIGYILDISEKIVKSRLFTARQMLKDILTKQGYLKHDRRQIH